MILQVDVIPEEGVGARLLTDMKLFQEAFRAPIQILDGAPFENVGVTRNLILAWISLLSQTWII
jgi:hypothetical protein